LLKGFGVANIAAVHALMKNTTRSCLSKWLNQRPLRFQETSFFLGDREHYLPGHPLFSAAHKKVIGLAFCFHIYV